MRKFTVSSFFILLLVALGAAGCVQTHINGVAEEDQGVELFILRSGQSLQKMDAARNSVLETAVRLRKSGNHGGSDFAAILRASKDYDIAFKTALSALLELRQRVDRGEAYDTAVVKSALNALCSELTKLQGEI